MMLRALQAVLAISILPLYGQSTLKYLGCFTDTDQRDINGLQTYAGSPQACFATCAAEGFRYAGMQAGNQCFCGASYGRYGASSGCRSSPGDASQTCGGSYANAIWNLGATGSPVPSAASPAASSMARSLALSTTGSPMPSAASAAPPPPSLGNWRIVGTGDCPGRDVAGTTGPNPDPAKCTPQFAGFTAVCWGNNCTYKNVPTAQCTGGANPGRMYTCAASAEPPATARSLTGAWVHSADPNAQTPNSKVIVIQDGNRITLTQTYKMAETRNLWVTLVCSGTLLGREVNLACDYAPGGNPLGFGRFRMSMKLSADGNHMDGTLSYSGGSQESHYSRVP